MKRIFLISIVLLFASSVLFAQTCVVCDDSYAITGASTIGTNNTDLKVNLWRSVQFINLAS